MSKNEKGKIGENLASEYLIKSGYEIIECNYTYKKYGEIDIIAYDDNYICFIEVKLRSNDNFGQPSEAVNKKKINKITMLSQIYLQQKRLNDVCLRYDVIEVKYINKNNYEINHIKNAF